MDKADAWIATTALYHGLPLATHDANFGATPGLRIITVSAAARAAEIRLPAFAGGRPLHLEMRCQCSY
jgi:hypothetical protein